MKKTVLLFLALIPLLFVSSCYSTTSLSEPRPSVTPLAKAEIGSYFLLCGEIIQAFNNKEALGRDGDIIVKLVTNKETFYDGKEFSDYYYMIDTYTYTTKQDVIKTVPVFIKASEYDAAKPLESEEEPKEQKL